VAQKWLADEDTVLIEHASPVMIQADGKIYNITSIERKPANLIALANIHLFPGDQIIVDGIPSMPDIELARAPTHSLQIQRAATIRLQDGAQTLNIVSTASSLGEALWEDGIHLFISDLLNPAPQTSLWLFGTHESSQTIDVVLKHSRSITVHVDGKDVSTRSLAQRVGDALAEIGLSLQGLDYSIPDEYAAIPENGLIQIVRVQERVNIEHAPISFETEYQPAPEVEIDQQTIIRPGEFGLVAKRVRTRYEDGQETSRQLEDEWVARQPVNRIVGYGTKIVMHVLDVPGGRIRYWRALQMYATSYHPSVTGDITASGLPLRKGVAAIDIRYIPFYTRMYVPGYGEALAADTGSGVKGRWIDLGYSDDDYVSWHKWVTVYFLWPPPENIVWIIP
jgi:uncharacterized protein YabE (DUF348 family)